MKEKKGKEKKENKYFDKSQIFVKAMAGILAILMIITTGATLVFALLG